MTTARAVIFRGAAAVAALGGVGASLAACSGPYSTLDPANDEAARIAGLGWLMFVIAAIVFVAVTGLVLYALGARNGRRVLERVPPLALVLGGGVLLPLAILPLVWVLSLEAMGDLLDDREGDGVTIDVVAHQWWYEVSHGEGGPVLTDEIRIPAGERVLLRLHSADVIHSFWAPRLGAKLDMIPGLLNERLIQVDEPGTFDGLCAEFCGLRHTDMRFRLVVMPPSEFASWLEGSTP